MASVRTAGTALAILGGLSILGSLGLAWPRPDILVSIGVVNAVILVTLAVFARLPVLHAAAVGSATIAYVIGFHWIQGNWALIADVTGRQLLTVLMMGRTAVVLLPAAAVVAALGAVWWYGRRPREAESYWFSAAIITGGSVVIAVYAGFWSGIDASWTTLVFLVSAMGLLAGGGLRCDCGSVGWVRDCCC